MSNRKLVLPSFAEEGESAYVEAGKTCIKVVVDPDKAYPMWLELLASEDYPDTVPRLEDASEPDQFWLEVVYQCAKLDVQAALVGTDYDPRIAGKAAEINILNRPDWALKNFPKGKGVDAASKGRLARQHYKRIRGSLPF